MFGRVHDVIVVLSTAGLVCTTLAAGQSNSWQSTEGPLGAANASAIATAPNGTIYAGINGLGMYSSSDTGANWSPTGLHPSLRHLESILILQNGYLFACSFNDIYGQWGSLPGVVRSRDGGSTWTTVLALETYQGTMLAATSDGTLIAGGAGHPTVDRSTDFGDSWTTVLNYSVRTITVDRSDNLYLNTSSQVLRSTDHGLTWHPTSEPMVNKLLWGLSATTIGTLFVTALDNTTYKDTLLRSTEFGAIWTALSPSLFSMDSPGFVANPNGPDIIGSNYYGIVRSTDNGWVWSTIYPYGSIVNVAFDSTGSLLGALPAGIVRSSDFGATWDTVGQGSVFPQITTLLCTQSGAILAGTNDAGVFRFPPAGAGWNPVASIRSKFYQLAQHPGGDIFGATNDYGLVSHDDGLTWDNSIVAYWHFPFHLSIDSTGSVYAAGHIWNGSPGPPFVSRSTDSGVTWATIFQPSYTGGDVTSLLAARLGTVLVNIVDASGNKYLYRSSDTGATWLTTGLGYPSNDYANLMLLAPSGELYAGTTSSGVFRSSDNGTSWKAVNVGLSSTSVHALAANSAGFLFAGTETGGVFRSIDGGDHWTPFNAGLSDPSILSLEIDIGGHLLAGTRSRGVWRTTNSTNDVYDDRNYVPDAYSLSQNYPNPFNPSTTIKFELPRESHVTLTVYDVLGREVSVLVNEKRNAGVHEVRFDGSGLASGLYLYRIQAGTFVQTKQLLLLR